MKKLYIPPTLIVYCMLIMLGLFFFVPQYNIMVFPYNLIGLIVSFSGFMFMGKARDLFKKHNTTVKIKESSSLITEGVFSKTRNPMYMGMFVLILGFSILSMNVFSLILPFVFLLLVRFLFIREEESLMHSRFGEEYIAYKKKIRRWV